jgi:hypothetical protein
MKSGVTPSWLHLAQTWEEAGTVQSCQRTNDE